LFGYSNGVFFENKVEVVNDTQNEHFLQWNKPIFPRIV
jgi:hypothetical protein